jgi:pSer/pThr/pTyr-binding forkhead associated (FHA) protein
MVAGAGDMVGRSLTAAICLDDPRVSEAHAMLSLRGRSLWLLALRGRLRVNTRFCAEVELDVGTEVELAPGLTLRCVGLELPREVLGVSAPGLGTVVLFSTTSLVAGPPPALRPGAESDADVIFWTLGSAWRYQLRHQPPKPLQPGMQLQAGGLTVHALLVPIEEAARTRTIPALRPGFRFEVHPHAVHIFTAVGAPADVTGVPGRLLGAMLRADGPIEWRDLCECVWPGDKSRESSLRNRLDVGLARLRERLREAGVSDVGLGLDGAGAAHVRLTPLDTVILRPD